ncbi:MAG TPA: inositol 2-dehydrogenase [Anaerolineaceae bacterium]
MKLRFGLIGVGRMGKVYAHHLTSTVQDVELVAIADPAPGAAAEAAMRWGGVPLTDYRDLLKREDIQAVVIATPTHTHVEVVKAAAAAGKQIFCEKPLSLTLEGCDDAIQAVEAAGVMLQIGFNRRFDPAHVAAMEKIKAGVIGKPVMFRSSGRDPKRTSLEFARRESSGGMILDMGIHEFDTARWMMGSDVVRVSTEGGCLVYPELKSVGDIDNAVINLRYENGAIGQIDLTRNAVYGHDVRTEIIGSEGALYIAKLQYTDLLVMKPNNISHDTVPYFMERFAEAYSAELKDFVACLREGREPSATGKDARAATAIGIAATQSLDEGVPVEVNRS